jgi:hypothetical protein
MNRSLQMIQALARSRELLATPVTDQQIDKLRSAGRDQWATGMVRANEQRYSACWFTLRSEPSWRPSRCPLPDHRAAAQAKATARPAQSACIK